MIYTLLHSMYFSILCENKRDMRAFFKSFATQISQKYLRVTIFVCVCVCVCVCVYVCVLPFPSKWLIMLAHLLFLVMLWHFTLNKVIYAFQTCKKEWHAVCFTTSTGYFIKFVYYLLLFWFVGYLFFSRDSSIYFLVAPK